MIGVEARVGVVPQLDSDLNIFICADDTSYQYRNKGNKFTCQKYIRKNLNLCDTVDKKNGGFVYEYCPVTCDRCDDVTDDGSTDEPTDDGGGSEDCSDVTFPFQAAGQTKDRLCEWYKKKDKCGNAIVAENCKESCDNCDDGPTDDASSTDDGGGSEDCYDVSFPFQAAGQTKDRSCAWYKKKDKCGNAIVAENCKESCENCDNETDDASSNDDTPTDDGECKDTEGYKYNGKAKFPCSWAASKSTKLCGKADKVNGGIVSDHCPETCGSCPAVPTVSPAPTICEDLTKGKVVVKNVPKKPCSVLSELGYCDNEEVALQCMASCYVCGTPPTAKPSFTPSYSPSWTPSSTPSYRPTVPVTEKPSMTPSDIPSETFIYPSESPTVSSEPSVMPSHFPSGSGSPYSAHPSSSAYPSDVLTVTLSPSNEPSQLYPSTTPTTSGPSPLFEPSAYPSDSDFPSSVPSLDPAAT